MRWLVSAVLVGTAVACSSTQGGGSTSGAVTPNADAGLDGSADAGAGPATCITEAGVGLQCAGPVIGPCPVSAAPPYGACGETWQSALARDPCSWIAPNAMGVRTATCGSLNVMAFDGADGGTEYFFDATSGALVAIMGFSAPGFSSCGGPACFVLPTCNAWSPSSCPGGRPWDAGDADVRDAGGQ